MHELSVNRSLVTALTVEKVEKIAAETGVLLTHTETRFAGKGKWMNDFEITGPPGKVDAFFERIDDIRRD